MGWPTLKEVFVTALGLAAFVGLWLVPDPVGKIVELWNFWKGK